MLWASSLIYLIVFCTGALLDIILEPNTKSLTVLVGEPTTFRCSITGGDLKNYQMSWYKKSEDNTLTPVYRLSHSSKDNSKTSFKGKIDTLKSQYVLDIPKTTIKDAGTYYCGSDIHGATILFLLCLRTLGVKLKWQIESQTISGSNVYTTAEMRPPDSFNCRYLMRGTELR